MQRWLFFLHECVRFQLVHTNFDFKRTSLSRVLGIPQQQFLVSRGREVKDDGVIEFDSG